MVPRNSCVRGCVRACVRFFLTVAIIGLGSGRCSSSRRPQVSQVLIKSSGSMSHEYSVPYHGSTWMEERTKKKECLRKSVFGNLCFFR